VTTLADMIVRIAADISTQENVRRSLGRIEKHGYQPNNIIHAAIHDRYIQPERRADAVPDDSDLKQFRRSKRRALLNLARVFKNASSKAVQSRELIAEFLDPVLPSRRAALAKRGIEFISEVETSAETLDKIANLIEELLDQPTTIQEFSTARFFGRHHSLKPPVIAQNASRTHLKLFLNGCKRGHGTRVYNGFYEDVATVYSAVGYDILPESVKKLSIRSKVPHSK
jgi:hypothetical protein